MSGLSTPPAFTPPPARFNALNYWNLQSQQAPTPDQFYNAPASGNNIPTNPVQLGYFADPFSNFRVNQYANQFADIAQQEQEKKARIQQMMAQQQDAVTARQQAPAYMAAVGNLDRSAPDFEDQRLALMAQHPLAQSLPHVEQFNRTLDRFGSLDVKKDAAQAKRISDAGADFIKEAGMIDRSAPDAESQFAKLYQDYDDAGAMRDPKALQFATGLRDHFHQQRAAQKDLRLAALQSGIPREKVDAATKNGVVDQEALAEMMGQAKTQAKREFTPQQEQNLWQRHTQALDEPYATEKEKQAWMTANPGKSWSNAYEALNFQPGSARYRQRGVVRDYLKRGYEIDPQMMGDLGMDNGQPAPVTAPNPNAPQLGTPQQAPQTEGLDFNSLMNQRGQEEAATQAQAQSAQVAQAQQFHREAMAPVNEAWTGAKSDLKEKIDDAFEDKALLGTIYKAIANGQRLTMPGLGDNEQVSVDPLEYLLQTAKINPNEAASIPVKKSLGRSIKQADVALELAREIASKHHSVSYLSPRGTRVTVGTPKVVSK